MTDETPKLHIDSDWKAEAQAEKERLAAQAEANAQAPGAHGGPLPDPDFRAVLGIVAQPAIMGLGAMGDPSTGRVVVDLEGAKFSIGCLEILHEKCKDNLSDEESTELTQLVSELKARYVQIETLVAQQAAAPGGMPGAAPGAGAPGSIVMP